MIATCFALFWRVSQLRTCIRVCRKPGQNQGGFVTPQTKIFMLSLRWKSPLNFLRPLGVGFRFSPKWKTQMKNLQRHSLTISPRCTRCARRQTKTHFQIIKHMLELSCYIIQKCDFSSPPCACIFMDSFRSTFSALTKNVFQGKVFSHKRFIVTVHPTKKALSFQVLFSCQKMTR